jgi:hypothetical protein
MLQLAQEQQNKAHAFVLLPAGNGLLFTFLFFWLLRFTQQSITQSVYTFSLMHPERIL